MSKAEIKHIHQYVYENGYKICVNCGIAETETYFNIECRKIEENNKNSRKRVLTTSNSQNWNRLLRIDKYKEKVFTKSRFYLVLNLLTEYLNDTQIELLKVKVLQFHKLNRIKDVYKAVYEECYKNDFSITSKELTDVFQEFSKNTYFKILQDTSNLEIIRKYYWLINKTLNKCQLSMENHMRCYKMVYNYYRLIRFGMNSGINPVLLIKTISYFTLKYVDWENRKTQEFFGIESNHPEIAKFKNYMIKIKERNLDKKILDKLEI